MNRFTRAWKAAARGYREGVVPDRPAPAQYPASNFRRLVEGAILLTFFLLSLFLNGALPVLLRSSPAVWAIIAGLFLLAGFQKVLPFLQRRGHLQPELLEQLSTAEWKRLVLALSLCCLLLLVFPDLYLLAFVLMPILFASGRLFQLTERKG